LGLVQVNPVISSLVPLVIQ